MTDEEIPLLIRPRRENLPPASVSTQALLLHNEPGAQPELPKKSGPVGEPAGLPLEQPNEPVRMDDQQKQEVPNAKDSVALFEAEGPSIPAGLPPLLLSPTGPVRLIEDAFPEKEPLRRTRGRRLPAAQSIAGCLLLLVMLLLIGLWLAREVVSWAEVLAVWHPLLRFAVYAAIGGLLSLGLLILAGQYRGYLRLLSLGNLRDRLEQARRSQVSKSEDGVLRQEYTTCVDKLAAAGAITTENRRAVLATVQEPSPVGAWVDPASARLLRELDGHVKQLVEHEARIVGVTTALSPSGPLDTVLVLWRNTHLVFRIAEIYGVRPGAYGSYRLLQRVVANMVVAGLSQEALQMLYAAYGPAAVEAASRGFRSFFELVSKGGLMLATVEPLTGGLLAVGGAVGKGTADFAGATAAQITGPLLQGVLNALLTLRIGLAAQNECRLVSLSASERRTQSAGMVSALLGFFLTVRRTVSPVAGGVTNGQESGRS